MTISGLVLTLLAAGPAGENTAGPPEGFASSIVMAPGWTARLVASEPQVVDPVAVRWDGSDGGRLWVVEMPDYPIGPPEGQPPRGRVRVLRDEDRDGRYESADTFADGLNQPTGVQPWRSGCLVTLAGELVYLMDSTGDGRADTREVWLRGLAEGNEQLRPNHPTLAPDGWLYVANGLRTTTVTDPRSGVSVDVGGRDIRIDPTRGGVIEAVSGHAQHGLSFDAYGRRFVCSNARPLDYAVLPSAVLARNRLLRSAVAADEVVPAGQARPVYPLVDQWTTSVHHAGSFTAACGLLIRESGGEPEALICEPTGSLIHRERLTDRGSSFAGRPGRDGVEFLASTDAWFRPVDLAAGPAGSVFVADFCRAVIEHPHWMTPEAQARADFDGGRDRGRIYQLLPPTPLPLPEISDAAFRRGLESGDPSAIGTDTPRTPAGRLRRLHLLERTGRLDHTTLSVAMRDSEVVVRERAARLWDRVGDAERAADLLALADDADAKVRLRVAVALGRISDKQAIRRLADIGASGDVWTRRAVLASSSGRAAEVLDALDGGPPQLRRELARMAVREASDAASFVATRVADAPLFEAVGLFAGLREAGRTASDVRLPPDYAGRVVAAAEEGDIDAVRLLADLSDDAVTLLLLTTDDRPEVREAAWTGLIARTDLPLPDELYGTLASRSPADRASVLAASLAGPSRTVRLLRVIERGELSPDVIDRLAADRLRSHADETIRRLARDVLPDRSVDVAALMETYRPALAVDTDAARGQALFREHCGVCHRVGRTGGIVGPDLSDLRTKTREALLLSVLDPDAAVDARYAAYTVETTAGRVLSGVLVGESSEAVTLRGSDGRETTVTRDEVEALHASGKSLMPGGFERRLDPPAVADLIEYLKTWRFLPADATAEAGATHPADAPAEVSPANPTDAEETP